MPPAPAATAAPALRRPRRCAPRPWAAVVAVVAGAAVLLASHALADPAELADTHGFSSRDHYWPKAQPRSQTGQPPPSPSDNMTSPVPYTSNKSPTKPPIKSPKKSPTVSLMKSPKKTSSKSPSKSPLTVFSDVVESLNVTEEGRQLIPLLPLDGDLSGDFLLGYSHNPWGASSTFREVLLDHLGTSVATPERTSVTSLRRGGRGRRSVLHLYNMLVCATGCNPMAFKGYGCYCGFLGSGYTVDGIDRCCKMHDWCYDTANCPMFLEYFVPYLWQCYRGRPRCALNGSSCSQRLCECDRRLAECLRNYPCPRRKAVCTSSPWRLLQNLFML